MRVHFAPVEAQVALFGNLCPDLGAISEYLERKDHGHEIGKEDR